MTGNANATASEPSAERKSAGRGVSTTLVSDKRDCPLNTERETNARCGRATDLLNEPIVPAARRNSVLCSHLSHHELERSPSIVIEPANETRIYFKRNIQLLQTSFNSVKVILTGVAKVIEHDWGIAEFICVNLAIKHREEGWSS